MGNEQGTIKQAGFVDRLSNAASDSAIAYARRQSMPFEQRFSDTQELTFETAIAACAAAGVEWSEQKLRDMHVTSGERNMYTNLALLVSDQCPFSVKCAAFDSEIKTHIVERSEFRGSVLSQLDGTMQFLNAHCPQDDWPHDALQEALVNAVLHRDYNFSGPTLVNVFADRVEIVSLGGLVTGLELNDLLNGISQPRNPLLAELFCALDRSDNYGTGIQRITDAYDAVSVSPKLRVGPSSMAVVLPRMIHHTIDDGDDDFTRYRKNMMNNSNDDGGSEDRRKAIRYMFPQIRSFDSFDAPMLLAEARVLSCAPLHSVSLNRTEIDDSLTTQQISKLIGVNVEQLEQATLRLLTRDGVALTREHVMNTVGLNRQQATDLLNILECDGKITLREDASYKVISA